MNIWCDAKGKKSVMGTLINKKFMKFVVCIDEKNAPVSAAWPWMAARGFFVFMMVMAREVRWEPTQGSR